MRNRRGGTVIATSKCDSSIWNGRSESSDESDSVATHHVGRRLVQDEPPADVHYYGSWGDVEELTATVFTIDGPERVVAPLAELPPIMIPDRREVKIGQLEARIAELESKYGENVRRLA